MALFVVVDDDGDDESGGRTEKKNAGDGFEKNKKSPVHVDPRMTNT